MTELQLYLLGTPRIEWQDAPLEINRRKEVALLAYLALVPHAQRRDALATLLWPGYDQSYARANLRRALSRLGKLLEKGDDGNGDGSGWLRIEWEEVSWANERPWVDVAQFQQQLAICETHGHGRMEVCPECLEPLRAASVLYRGDFLTGFSLRDSLDFDEWQLFQTESLRQSATQALDRLVRCYVDAGDVASAIDTGRRWLAHDPFHEPALRALMRLYAQVGDRGAAVQEYGQWMRMAETELNMPPSDETTALYEAIRQGRGRFAASISQPIRSNVASSPEKQNGSNQADHPVDHAGQIRPVTVLYSALDTPLATEVGPEEWTARIGQLLARAQERLARYDAQIDRLLGDSVVAIFGATRAHEDDAERAIHAALELLDIAAEFALTLRAGICSGEVYYGAIGNGSQTSAAVGPVVNLAGRLADRAEPGDILVNDGVYRQTRLAFRFATRAETIPGQRNPVTVHQLVRVRRQPRKTRGIETRRSELVGRLAEMGQLTAALDQLMQGAGRLVALTGEAGTGKSRLVAELSEVARTRQGEAGREILFLEGRCVEMNQGTPYAPFVNLLHTFFALQSEQAPGAVAGNIQTTLETLSTRNILSADDIDEIGPLLGRLLSVQFGYGWDDYLDSADPQQIRHRMFAGLQVFFRALAEQRPLVLVLEDLHWADDLSLELISELMEVLTAHPLLLLCVYRPTQEHRSQQLATIARRKCAGKLLDVSLHELSYGQTEALVASLLETTTVPDGVVDMIYGRAQGNPFFTEEVVRSLLDGGVLYQEGDQWRAGELPEDHQLPMSVQNYVLSRFDQLPVAQQELLQQAAVIGHIFPLDLLTQIANGVSDLDGELSSLEDRGLVYLERTMPQVEYAFRHVLTQEAIYRTLVRKQRTLFHRQTAEAIEQLYGMNLSPYYEQLTHHYERGDMWVKTIEYLVKAGEKAQRAFLNEEAIHYFERARVMLKEQQAKPELDISVEWLRWQLTLTKGLGELYQASGKIQEAESCFHEAIALCERVSAPRIERYQLYRLLGEQLYWQHRYEELIVFAEMGLEELGDDLHTTEAAFMNHLIAAVKHSMSDQRAFLAYVARNLQFLDRLPYVEELRPAYFGIIKALAETRDEEKLQHWLQRFEDETVARNDLSGLSEVHLVAAITLSMQGDYQKALTHLETGIGLFVRIGSALHVDWSLSERGLCHLLLGEVDDASDTVNRLYVEIAEGHVNADSISSSHVNTSHVAAATFACQRQWEQAVATLETILEHIGIQQWPHMHVSVNNAIGRYQLLQGNRPGAYDHLPENLHAYLRFGPANEAYKVSMFRSPLVDAVSGLEATAEDRDSFRALCDELRAEHMRQVEHPLLQWYLEVATPGVENGELVYAFPGESAEGNGSLVALEDAGWRWHDPVGDASLHITDDPEHVLRIHTANGSDLWHINLRAPRLLRPVAGDFAIEAVCDVGLDDRPAIGGVLLWQDRDNFVHLTWGTRGTSEVVLEGCVQNQSWLIGRGALDAERPILRLERVGTEVRALCSGDGTAWYSVGTVEMSGAGVAEVGIHAIGHIDRSVYLGAFLEGAAIRFLSVRLWQNP